MKSNARKKNQSSSPIESSISEDQVRVLLAAIVESSDDAIIGKTLDGIITTWNTSAYRMFGYTAEEIIGHSVLQLVPPELHDEETEILHRLSLGQRIEHFETRRLGKDGQVLDVSLTVSPIRDASGRVIGASKIARDISDRKRLDEARFRLASIVESSQDAIIANTLDGIITTWNDSATRMFGYTAAERIGQSILKIVPLEHQFEEARITEKLRAGEPIEHFETVRQSKSGGRIEVSITASPIRDAKGKVVGASKFVRDMSFRKQAETALIESEKLAVIGRVAATIAHEINNPLEGIANIAYLMSTNEKLGSEAREYADMLLKEVSQLTHITKKTLAYCRDTRVSGDVPLTELLDNVIEIQRLKILRKNIRIETDYRTAGVVLGQAAELRQVFANFVVNAIDALQPNGTLRIRVKSVGFDSSGLSRRVMVTIADTGSGITSEVRKRMFEPFFTTKGEQGNGLGLWVSGGIIQKHNGKIMLRSNTKLGHSGTVFTIVLPGFTANPLAVDQAS